MAKGNESLKMPTKSLRQTLPVWVAEMQLPDWRALKNHCAVPLGAVTLDRDLSLHFYAPAANGDSDNYSSETDFCEGLGGVRRVQVMQIPKSWYRALPHGSRTRQWIYTDFPSEACTRCLIWTSPKWGDQLALHKAQKHRKFCFSMHMASAQASTHLAAQAPALWVPKHPSPL